MQSTAARTGDASVDATEAADAHASSTRERRFRMLLAVVALLGLAARIVYVVLVRDRPLFPDSLGYHFRAQLLADGEGFVVPARQMLGAASNPPDAECAAAVVAVPRSGRPGWDCGRSCPNRWLRACSEVRPCSCRDWQVVPRSGVVPG